MPGHSPAYRARAGPAVGIAAADSPSRRSSCETRPVPAPTPIHRPDGEPFAFAKVQSAPGWDQQPGWRTWLKVRWFQGFSSSMSVGDGLRRQPGTPHPHWETSP